MKYLAILIAVLISAQANDDVQYVKTAGVKGGHGGRIKYHGGDNINFYQNETQHGMRHNMTAGPNFDVGVCYIQVPTASLVRDKSHVPVGNGTQPDLSLIRSCCKGYIRNIYNYLICDPVCTNECVNGLCTAPETCTCFPDHIRNSAGFCVATCPIGCQNGRCSGRECICNDGYKLDNAGKFCQPICSENCGGIGNCTAPNTCDCKAGYKSSPQGSCQAVCDKSCINGDCIAPNQCQCHNGYQVDHQGNCKPLCQRPCENGDCVAPNRCECHPGYNLDQSGLCKPSCDRGCENGVCAAPNQCTCNNGYGLKEGKCEAVCVNGCGTTGRCTAPNVCTPISTPIVIQPNQPNHYPNQPNGQYPYQPDYSYPQNGQPPYHPNRPNQYPFKPEQYQPDQYYNQPRYPLQPGSQHIYPNIANETLPEGVPQCSLPCINGVCELGDRCNCNPGYVVDEEDVTRRRCLPHCPGGCPNGVCSAPRFCICNIGYYKDHSVKGRQVCVKRIRRSVVLGEPLNVAELLMYNIPDY